MLSKTEICYCKEKKDGEILWKTCFPADSPHFVSFYMNHVHKEKDSLALYGDEGDVRAYLGMVPYDLKKGEEQFACSYLSGVCTLPEFRGRGYMTAMIKRAFREMFDRGDVFSTLIPAKPDLYLKFGFTDAFFIEEQPLPKGEGRGWQTDWIPEISEWYSKSCQKKNSFFVHRTEEQWKIISEEHFQFEQGELWCNEGAYAFVSRFDKKTVVKEAMGEDSSVHALLCQIGEGVWLTEQSQTPLGQARVIRVKEAMKCLPDCCYRVTDPWISENNGTFSVKSGQVKRCEESAPEISISELTSLIFQGRNYMNLMLN